MTPNDLVAPALEHARANRAQLVADLERFVSFPSVSASPRSADAVASCAAWLVGELRRSGLEDAELVAAGRHPIVRASWSGARAAPTLLVYGHYDVQPPGSLAAWRTPPFRPTRRDGFLYGRGASDDKGPLLAHVAALRAYLAGAGALPVNVECLFEGEEEIGSPGLGDYLRASAAARRADVAVVSDTRMRTSDRPSITYALRGALSAEVEIRGPPRELHSGQFGGAVENPLETLCALVADLRARDGTIAIPSFYDAVRDATAEEREHLRRTGPDDVEILRDAGVPAGTAERGYTLYEQTTLRPSLTVSGITGGYDGPGVKGAIPPRAVAKLAFRLVPDQEPRTVEALLRRHIAHVAPGARVRVSTRARPALVDLAHPALRAATVACRHAFGTEPAYLRSGGTIPVVSLLDELLGVPTVLLGLALPDDGMHAANERFLLRNLARGTEASIWLLAELARRSVGVPRRAATTVTVA
jgi:acetylornithine deacetylase/succinyl-diaminopimelate desuccinylase-like protein